MDGTGGVNVRYGHTLLTWDVFREPANIEQGIRDIAALGFEGTETGGGLYDWWEANRPGRLKAILREAGIPMVTLFHSGEWTNPAAAPDLLERARRWSDAIGDMGGEMLMLVPGRRGGQDIDASRGEPVEPFGLDDFKVMAEAMNRAGEIAQRAGIDATMHPHWGTAAESRLEIEVLLDSLDPKLIGFAPDTGQIAKGGADPFPIMDRWKSMIRYVHMKDLAKDWEEKRRAGVPLRSPEGYCEMGQGVIDFRRMISALESVNFTGWLMAELDEAKRPGGEAARLSKEYIDRILR
ncbi:MAG: TIM barrel protein [Chloroflexi bacterium]|nr:TIM barrel protein [Chloroflexota bacterium]